MLMHSPPHPGEIIRELCLEPLGISVGSQRWLKGVFEYIAEDNPRAAASVVA
jgi:hypothetical protein